MAEETKQEQTASVDNKKQEKLKRQSEIDNQDEEIKQMDPDKLREKLSNKNQDYVFRLEKELQLQGSLSQIDARQMTNKLLGEIIVAQRHGQPANGLYLASPRIKAEQMLHPEKKPTPTPFWQLAVDGAGLYLVFFLVLIGVMDVFQPNQSTNSQMGILTVASVGIIMGIIMVRFNDWVVPSKNGKRSWSKAILSIIGTAGGIFILTWVLSIPALKVINPVLPGSVDLIIAAVVYGLRYLFRKHYHIVGSAFAPRPEAK